MATKKKVFQKLTNLRSVGISAVSPVVRFLGRLINNVVVIDEDGDGDVEGGEILTTVQKVGFDAFATFRGFDFPQFKTELNDVDPEERQQLVDAFAEEFDIPNDEAEYLIEDWLEWANRGATLVGRTRKATSKKVAA